ncbi:MAG TPA: class I SAM-dependent methyltransferase [Candidatus Baltobacteraceae bacterium]|jgi:ubiquinone/menaquinone biosynthesis C-methylase UbiE|nr:class I SAM-dependent methyltransferase [Candidatus Baltobacteraceae bacterium]
MQLLPLNRLVRTSGIDHADWNYRPLLAYAARRRFALALSLLPKEPVSRLLEVGFGGGIFMPELARHCIDLYGIDIHGQVPAVREALSNVSVNANLYQRDAARTDFPDGFFDRIVLISALEFIGHVEDAAREFVRLLTPQGRVIAVMPAKSRLLDFSLRVMTGEDANRDYGQRRELALPAMLQWFRIRRTKSFAGIYKAYEFEACS